ncbi:MAG: PLP-dependent aminotransferase family protein [Lachnospira sp.]
MLTYDFSDLGGKSLYEYLYECIKNDIYNGKLKSGEHLPSKRSFAQNLGVSTITVENAYGQLMGEGFIYSIPKKGYFVADISESAVGYTNHSAKEANPPCKDEFDCIPQLQKYDIDFSSNRTGTENFPFSVWAKLLREVVAEKSEKLMNNPPSGGVSELREAIAGHLQSFRGMKVSPSQIVVGAGTEYLYGLLIQLLGRDRTYGLEDPGYMKTAKVYASNAVRCCYIGMDSQGMNVRELIKSNADIAHVSPTHHFPTGITMPVNRRLELLSWANEKDYRYIIEDEYDSEFRLNGKPVPTLQSIDRNGKVIYMNTFSKSLTSTIRISYMVLPEKLAEKFYKNMNFYACTVSNFEQYTLARFIKEGYFEKHINRMRLYYTRQRKRVFEIIEESPLSDRCEIIERDSGLHFLLRLKTDLSDEQLEKRLRNHGIHMSALSEYYQKQPDKAEHTFIFNYSNIDVEHLNEALCVLVQQL